MTEAQDGEDADFLVDQTARRTKTIGPGRNQFTLGSLMILIAILAVALAFPCFSVELLMGGVACMLLIVVPIALDVLLLMLCQTLGDHFQVKIDGRPRAYSPAERDP
jgi:hypothetical protein